MSASKFWLLVTVSNPVRFKMLFDDGNQPKLPIKKTYLNILCSLLQDDNLVIVFHLSEAFTHTIPYSNSVAREKSPIDYCSYFCERLFTSFFIFLTRALSLGHICLLAEPIGAIVSMLFPGHRRRVVGNLNLAFGSEKTREEKMALYRGFNTHLIKSYFEMLYSTNRAQQKNLIQSIQIMGQEHLDQCLQKGKGVIGIGGHFGNFTVMGLKMNEVGYRFHTVVRGFVDPLRNKMYERFRIQQGQPFIYTHRSRQAITEIIRVLRRNEIVFLIVDENERIGGVFVDFFSRPASTNPGPAILHLRTGADIIPILFFRNHDNTHKIIIEPPLTISYKGSHKKNVEEITKVITQKIEEYVRKYPSQWMWTHRRWRTRPPEEKAKGVNLTYEQY